MKTSQVLGAIVLSILGITTSAQAEQYQGVQRIESVRARSDVAADARAATRMSVFGEALVENTRAVVVGEADRTAVRTGAMAASRAGNIYGDAASAGVLRLAQNGMVARESMRAQAQ